jgi:signal transduction histidine kinase
MAISLRTRLFVSIGAVLAASIAAAGLLSRRATLVEIREIVAHTAPPPVELGEAARAVEARLWADGTSSLDAALVESAAIVRRPLLLLDPPARAAIAASSPLLRDAVIHHASPSDGDLEIEIRGGPRQGSVVLKGVRSHRISDRDGGAVGWLFALPPDSVSKDVPVEPPPAGIAPKWVTVTISVGAIALLLTFALARRILRPITELTNAVRRMESGDLAVRVQDAAASGDEIGGLATSFNAMAERLAEHERARRQMVADVAHELRSPVTNLRCALEAIQDGLAPADRAAIDALHDETMFLQRLIADLQDLTLAEAGRLDIHIEAVDAGVAIRRAIGALAADKGASIAVDLVDGLPPVAADPSRLEQVLRNLLSNARRHTPDDGRITIVGRLENGFIAIDVADTGSGLEAAHVPHVFDRFYRADPSRSRTTGGAGLGLAIVRQLVHAHGGTVDAWSAGPGRGSTFTVRLPAASA